MDYHRLYRKYKRKYLRLRGGDQSNGSNEPFIYENRSVDWYLFFDLYQITKDILLTTPSDAIIILVGDTPSYLEPLLNRYRETHHFAFSNKAFGCLFPPYATKPKGLNVDVYTPTHQNLYSYFNYLDTKTKLSRDFIKQHWHKIVLVDSSWGQSIHGVSIFFNRYINNIKDDDPVKCINLKGAKPLKFFQLVSYLGNTANLTPDTAKEIYPDKSTYTFNYRPDLIAYIGRSIFLHIGYFLFEEAYPRIVPFYSVTNWNQPPIETRNQDILQDNFKKLNLMMDTYTHLKTGGEMSYEFYAIKDIEPGYPYGYAPTYRLVEYLDKISENILLEKLNHYFTVEKID